MAHKKWPPWHTDPYGFALCTAEKLFFFFERDNFIVLGSQ